MPTVYVGYPRSSSHSKFLREICPESAKLILFPDRKFNSSDFENIETVGFYDRLHNRKEIAQKLNNYQIEKCIVLMPFFYDLPRGGIETILFEEGLSGYQKFYLNNPAISSYTKLKDLVKLLLVKLVMINQSSLLQRIVLGPNYAFGRKVNPHYTYFVTNSSALIPDKISPSVTKKLLVFQKHIKEIKNKQVILFILDPLLKRSKITFKIFIDFLNQKYSCNSNEVLFQIHPADLKNSHYLKMKFESVLKFNFNFIRISDLDHIPSNYKLEGLNSSLLYYHRIINGGEIHSHAEEYASKDQRYSSELLRRYGTQKINSLYE